MPRIARKKSIEAIYHVMSRSISEVDLFKDDYDKLVYLAKVKEYQDLYRFRVYCYCLMDNHAHLMIDANGADISKIMHAVNFSYALYFNKKHKRHGHLFQDRFKSKIINDERYLLNATAYIHNNTADLDEYVECPEKYKFSSLSVFLGIRNDPYGLIDNRFISNLFGMNSGQLRNQYKEMVKMSNDKEFAAEIEFANEGTEYRSLRKVLVRNFEMNSVIQFVTDKFRVNKEIIFFKRHEQFLHVRALTVVLLRSLCDMSSKEICDSMGNITQAGISKLCSRGIKLINNHVEYAQMVNDFIESYRAI